eukprot:jgi/Botrbrau1/22511/Bobra.114_2s0036.1
MHTAKYAYASAAAKIEDCTYDAVNVYDIRFVALAQHMDEGRKHVHVGHMWAASNAAHQAFSRQRQLFRVNKTEYLEGNAF